MARLNEPSSAPTESIESLKRRFMRQNRDIARANSAQSLRIRNLENETSRLLAENLDLREQILQLRNELVSGTAQRISERTTVIKSQLEHKLLEISTLITSLGDGSVPQRRPPQEGKVTKASPSRSPRDRNWRDMCTLSEAVADQEGRLPAILEDKSYPRKTLESQEIVDLADNIAADTTNSPDIGPPPVSQFVDEDPIKIDLPYRAKKDEPEVTPELDPALSVSIEQRKKRRDSSIASDSKRLNKTELEALEAKELTGTLKTGAKRKLDVRDNDGHTEAQKSAETSVDNFEFTRVAGDNKSKTAGLSQPERSGTMVARELAVARGALRQKQSASAAPSSRKVLAPKSVNNSPKKASKALIQDPMKPMKGEALKSSMTKERSQEKKPDHVNINPFSIEPPVLTVEVQLEPETPAGLDLFSPSSSQPSTTRNESRDTPPPPDLGTEADGSRPSRRARPAVSYAEPNLRDKMRRPTKELVDAVMTGTGSRRGSTIKSENDSDGFMVKIKPEADANEAWKSMPVASSATVENSPLSGKAAVPDSLSSSIATHRRRRESMLSDTDLVRGNSASAVAALLAGNRRLRADANMDPSENKGLPPKSANTYDIYDFRSSSPVTADDPAVRPVTKDKPVSRFSRRHTSVSQSGPPESDNEASEPEGSRKSDVVRSRRRQSALNPQSSSSSASTESSREEGAEKVLKKASSTIGISEAGSSTSRSDRFTARRKSMML